MKPRFTRAIPMSVVKNRLNGTCALFAVTLTITDRYRTIREMLDASGREQYVNVADLDIIFRRRGGLECDSEMLFFEVNLAVGEWINNERLEHEYRKRQLIPDPYLQFAINARDPNFAATYPNVTHWKNANGHWCFASFGRDTEFGIVDYVVVDQANRAWRDVWFGGIREL